MARWRLTIVGAMALVALAALGLAALRHPSPLVASCTFSVTVAMLSAAAVASISLRGRRRAAFASSTLCGSVYLGLALGPWFDSESGPHPATQPLIEMLYEWATGKGPARFVPEPGYDFGVMSPPSKFWTTPRGPAPARAIKPAIVWPLSQIAHCFFGLGAAALGGALSLALTRGSREPWDR